VKRQELRGRVGDKLLSSNAGGYHRFRRSGDPFGTSRCSPHVPASSKRTYSPPSPPARTRRAPGTLKLGSPSDFGEIHIVYTHNPVQV